MVINVILVYFSYFIVNFLLEFANVLQKQFYNLLSPLGNGNIVYTKGFELTGSDVLGQIGGFLFLIVMLIVVILALVYLYFVLIIRIIAIKLLVIVAPVVFILVIMPFFEKQLQRWWGEVFKWIFLGPAVMGTLLIGSMILKNAPQASQLDFKLNDGNILDGFQPMLYLMTSAAIFYFAAQIPKMMIGVLPGVGDKVKGWGKERRQFRRWRGSWDSWQTTFRPSMEIIQKCSKGK